uniref:Uncharacterized protein n=1 Tax=Panagrellus redivivus TaxID=6233 RepID=A0A7E4VP01_PANRE
MAVDLEQSFHFYDYLGPVAVGLIFALTLIILSFFILNFCLVSRRDELTVFEKFGSKHNLRLGPHSLGSIKRKEEHERMIALMEQEAKDNKNQPIVMNQPAPAGEGTCPVAAEIPQVQVEAASTS